MWFAIPAFPVRWRLWNRFA